MKSTLRKVLEHLRQGPRLKPPQLEATRRFTGFVALTGAWVALFQAFDYFIRPKEAEFNAHLTSLERTFPFEVWGWLFLVVGLITALGLYFEIWPFAIFGHGSLGIMYAALGIASWFGIVAKLEFPEWQTASLFLGAAIVHTYLADTCYDAWSREWRTAPPPVLGPKDDVLEIP